MRNKLIPLSLIASATMLCAQTPQTPQTSYTQIITQTEFDAAGNPLLQHLKDVAKNGSMKALDGIEFSSSFELHVINDQTNRSTFIDKKLVSAYLPKATVTISSPDSYVGDDGSRRIRADMNYTVNYDVSLLATDDPEATEAASIVNYDTTTVTFEVGNFVQTEAASVVTTRKPITQNGSVSEHHKPIAAFTSTSEATGLSGKATHSIFPHQSLGCGLEALSTQTIHIWPVTTGEIEGIEEGKSYSSLPDLTIKLTNTYPESYTFLKVVNPETKEETELNIGSYKNQEAIPTNREILVKAGDLAQYTGFVAKDGISIYLCSRTTAYPLANLDDVHAKAGGPIKINAQLHTAE